MSKRLQNYWSLSFSGILVAFRIYLASEYSKSLFVIRGAWKVRGADRCPWLVVVGVSEPYSIGGCRSEVLAICSFCCVGVRKEHEPDDGEDLKCLRWLHLTEWALRGVRSDSVIE